MRIKRGKYNNEESIAIYINKIEENSKDTLEKIKKYRQQFKNVCVFIGGNNRIEDILETILRDIKNY